MAALALLAGSLIATSSLHRDPPDGALEARCAATEAEYAVMPVDRSLWSIDDVFGAVSAEFPEFAGAYIEPHDPRLRETASSLVVLVASSRFAEERTIEEISESLEGYGLQIDAHVVVGRRADYPFGQLRQWRRCVEDSGLASTAGFIFSDVDERRNRVVFGFRNVVVVRPSVEAHLGRLGVPLDAVILEESGPFETR